MKKSIPNTLMTPRFKFLKHTADTKFRSYGKTLNEKFENAGIAFFEVMTNTKKVKSLITKEFCIESQDIKSLLYDFLEELLFIHETEKMFFNEFKVSIKGNKLNAKIKGEKISEKHELKALIKAVTYNDMLINEKFIQAVLDL